MHAYTRSGSWRLRRRSSPFRPRSACTTSGSTARATRSSTAVTLPMAARLVAAADAFSAMLQPRPYRPPFSAEHAAQALDADARAGRLDHDATTAVLAEAGQHAPRARRTWPAGLSDREVEVLALIAAGRSNAEVAETLVISRRTAEHHAQHIYVKIGVSTRAAAALFAVQHDLVRPNR